MEQIKATSNRFCDYFLKAIRLSPKIVLQLIIQKVTQILKRKFGLLRVHLFSTKISDAGFFRALNNDVNGFTDFFLQSNRNAANRFFFSPLEANDFLTSIRASYPNAEKLMVEAADRACNHVFDLLGSGPKFLGEEIDWHIDFKTGHMFDPDQFHADARYPAPFPGGYDIKVPWELSRCQHFVCLGQAYWFTGNEKYAQEFVEQILNWIHQNPPLLGVNWACTMDVAIRVVNWLWAYHYFLESPTLDDDFKVSFYKSLLSHGRYIFRNLERYVTSRGTLTSNHYLSNLLGLIYLGFLLPEFKEAKKWREFGLHAIEKEMFKQVYPDGTNFESSTSYHRLVTEMFLSATILARHHGFGFSPSYMQRLEKMVEFIMHITRPDGTVPLIGDFDNGRLHRVKIWEEKELEWVDFRYLLAIGAILFNRPDFAFASNDQWEEAYWIFGKIAGEFMIQYDPLDGILSNLRSIAYPDSGWYIMKDHDRYMFICAGSNGQNGNGGHKHNDTLSFDLSVFGQPVIIDAGTYLYTADFRERNLFRSTAFHNTIRVDEQEINRFDDDVLFALKDDTQPVVTTWSTTSEIDQLDAYHDGYQRLDDPVRHQRQIIFEKRLGFWVLRDRLIANGEHTYEFHLHFAPHNLKIKDQTAIAGLSENQQLLLYPLYLPEGLNLSIASGWVSYSYGQKTTAPVLRYTWKARGNTELSLAILPISERRKDRENIMYQKAEGILDLLRRNVEIL